MNDVVYEFHRVLESQTWQHDLTLCKQGGDTGSAL